MSDDQAFGFFIISVITLLAVIAGFGGVKYIADYREKKAKERRELEEAAKMFEQRIALRPKHMGSRIGMGVAGDVHFEPANDRKE
jgi:uncharacterized membrane protein